MDFGTLYLRVKSAGTPRQNIAWWLRRKADEIDGFQSIALKVEGDFTRDEIRSAWDHACREMKRALEDLATLHVLDDLVE